MDLFYYSIVKDTTIHSSDTICCLGIEKGDFRR